MRAERRGWEEHPHLPMMEEYLDGRAPPPPAESDAFYDVLRHLIDRHAWPGGRTPEATALLERMIADAGFDQGRLVDGETTLGRTALGIGDLHALRCMAKRADFDPVCMGIGLLDLTGVDDPDLLRTFLSSRHYSHVLPIHWYATLMISYYGTGHPENLDLFVAYFHPMAPPGGGGPPSKAEFIFREDVIRSSRHLPFGEKELDDAMRGVGGTGPGQNWIAGLLERTRGLRIEERVREALLGSVHGALSLLLHYRRGFLKIDIRWTAAFVSLAAQGRIEYTGSNPSLRLFFALLPRLGHDTLEQIAHLAHAAPPAQFSDEEMQEIRVNCSRMLHLLEHERSWRAGWEERRAQSRRAAGQRTE